MLQVTVRIRRENAIRAGLDRYGDLETSIDISGMPDYVLEYIARHPIVGKWEIGDRVSERDWPGLVSVDGVIAFCHTVAALERDAAIAATKKQADDQIKMMAEIDAWRSLPDDKRIQRRVLTGEWDIITDNRWPSDLIRDEIKRLQGVIETREKERKADEEKRKADEEKRKADAEKHKHAQLCAIVDRLGSDNDRERWAAGVMRRAEVLALQWQEIFAGVGAVPGGERLTDPELDETDESVATLNDREWQVYKNARRVVESNMNLCGINAELNHEFRHEYTDEQDIRYVLFSVTIGEYDLKGQVEL